MNGWANKEKIFYIYRHIRQDKNEPFYIGRGTGYIRPNKASLSHKDFYQRAFAKDRRHKIWGYITRKTNYDVEIIYETKNERECMMKEIEFIKLYGRIDIQTGILANCSDGGEGSPNPSEKSREVSSKLAKAQGLKNAKPIYIYSKEGVFLHSFGHRDECAVFFQCYKHHAVKMARQKSIVFDFLVSHEYEPNGVNPALFIQWNKKKYGVKIEQKNPITGKVIAIYNSLLEAENKSGVSDATISRNLNGTSVSGRYLWGYADMYDLLMPKLLSICG